MIVVGLTPRHLGPLTPRLSPLAREGGMAALDTVTPAVTCSVQASFMTGLSPRDHGVVANGWLFRDQMEILLWRQSNRLVGGEKIWEAGKKRDPAFTCANMFWWYNMASSHDFGATPRPIYKADGRKLPDCYTVPGQLRDQLTERFGPFPLFQFWGPGTSIVSTRWIADASKFVMAEANPTLTLAYLPHRDAGLLSVREEDGGELLDPISSKAFAVADHQIAHIYLSDVGLQAKVKDLLTGLDGVERVYDETDKSLIHLDHRRSGELVAIADSQSWFTYYYWNDNDRAPDFARTVEIHRKPGYDPVELFVDPSISLPKLAIGKRLLMRKLGFRTLMDVIPLDASLVRGSHGRLTDKTEDGPLVISSEPLDKTKLAATDVKPLLLDLIFRS